jgi:hypothetical protein
MTIANLNVTPLIDRQLHARLISLARKSIDSNIPTLSSMRPTAQRAWSALQAPIELADDIWLLLRPESVRVRPLTGKGTMLRTGIGVTPRPTLVLGPAPAADEQPLPPLTLSAANARGIHLNIQATMSYADMRRELESRLSDVLRHYGGGEVRLDGVYVATEDKSIVVTLKTAAPLPLTIRMTGKPDYDLTRNEVVLQDFHMQITSDDPVSQLVDTWLRQNLRGELQKHTAWRISGPLATVVRQLEGELNRRLPGNASIGLQINAVRFPRLHSTPDRLTLFAELDATAQLSIGN